MPCTHPTRLVLDRLGNPDRLRVVIKEDEVMVTRPDYAIDAAGVRKPRPWLPPSLSENRPSQRLCTAPAGIQYEKWLWCADDG